MSDDHENGRVCNGKGPSKWSIGIIVGVLSLIAAIVIGVLEITKDDSSPAAPLSPNPPTQPPVASPPLGTPAGGSPVSTPAPVPPVSTPAPVVRPTQPPFALPVNTLAPVNPPVATLSRSESIAAFINTITLTGRFISYPPTTGSPEERALQWLIDEDSLQLSADSGPGRFRLTQRYAMAVFYFTTNGSAWFDSSGWLGGGSECTWFGVNHCYDGTFGDAGTQSYVAEVDMDPAGGGNNIRGPFPTELGLLSSLLYLELDQNFISGQLPSEIGNLRLIREFHINDNSMTGTIPSTVSNWARAFKLYFFNNNFSGSVPDGICQYIDAGDDLVADCGFPCTCCNRCE